MVKGRHRPGAWQRNLAATLEEVEGVVRNPEQLAPGDRGVLGAPSWRDNGLLRVPFVARSDIIFIPYDQAYESGIEDPARPRNSILQ
jgi:hypothetical protein